MFCRFSFPDANSDDEHIFRPIQYVLCPIVTQPMNPRIPTVAPKALVLSLAISQFKTSERLTAIGIGASYTKAYFSIIYDHVKDVAIRTELSESLVQGTPAACHVNAQVAPIIFLILALLLQRQRIPRFMPRVHSSCSQYNAITPK